MPLWYITSVCGVDTYGERFQTSLPHPCQQRHFWYVVYNSGSSAHDAGYCFFYENRRNNKHFNYRAISQDRRSKSYTYPCTPPAVLLLLGKYCMDFSNSFEKEAAFDFISGDEQIILNVGGQKFKTTAGVLCRDRFSLLACICRTAPPISKDEDGSFFFERDW